MTRDEVRIRSEGALEAAELALTRIENVLKVPDWLFHVRAQTVMPDRIDDAVEQVRRLDELVGSILEGRRQLVAELTRKRLRELGVEPTATRLDDLVAQLMARARIAGPRPRRRVNPRVLAGGGVIALFTIMGLAGWDIRLVVWGGIAGLLFIAAIFREP